MINNFNPSQNLRLIKKCPICNTDYIQSQMQVLDESEFGVLTYITCRSCGANLLTKFASLPQGLIGNAILTDLEPQEVMSFASMSDLTADEVLEIQQNFMGKDIINKIRKFNQ